MQNLFPAILDNIMQKLEMPVPLAGISDSKPVDRLSAESVAITVVHGESISDKDTKRQ